MILAMLLWYATNLKQPYQTNSKHSSQQILTLTSGRSCSLLAWLLNVCRCSAENLVSSKFKTFWANQPPHRRLNILKNMEQLQAGHVKFSKYIMQRRKLLDNKYRTFERIQMCPLKNICLFEKCFLPRHHFDGLILNYM